MAKKLLNFIQAMAAIHQGKKIQGESWSSDEFWFYENNQLSQNYGQIVDETNTPATLEEIQDNLESEFYIIK